MIVWLLLLIVMVHTNSLKLSKAQLKLLSELSKNFVANKLIIISNHNDDANSDNIFIIKHLSENNLQTAFMSLVQLNATMYKNRRLSVFKPRHLVLLDSAEKNLSVIFNTRNEFYHWKIIWMTFDADETNFHNIYIPYNCEFLNIKTTDQTSYEIIEIYHLKLYDQNAFKIPYGSWNCDLGFKVSQLDFYTRRFNMNGSTIGIISDFKVSFS